MDLHGNPKHRVCERAVVRAGLPIASLLALALAVYALWLTGCAQNSPAEADLREVRLTHDGAVKHALRFSPDGKWIAYAALVGPDKGLVGLFVIPSAGGEGRKISPDTLGVYPLAWQTDGKHVLCRDIDGRAIYSIGLDGATELVRQSKTPAHVIDITPDGREELALRFNGDNRDLEFLEPHGKVDILTDTPEWEEDASFGPGPGEITVVSRPSYMAPVSTISIWAPEKSQWTPLPIAEGQNYQPTWSPDDKLMAYTVSRDGQLDVWIYDAATQSAVPLTRDPDDAGCPAWSSNGEWLAFCRSVHTSHLFAGDPRQGKPRPLTQGPARDYAPTVSPDGKWIAFLRKPASGSGTKDLGPNLCVMPISGGEAKELDLKGLTVPSKGMSIMTWSHDSRQLAFNASEGSSKLDIYRIARDGTGLARVTVDPGDDVEPHWSPDGRHIAYTQAGGGQLRVAVVPANGGLSRPVSKENETSEDGVWAPDSKRLTYLGMRNDGTFEVWVTTADRPEERTRVLESKEVAWPLHWSPDGREILLARGKGTDWRFTAVSVENGTETVIGKEVPLPSGMGMIVDLNEKGEAYRGLIYPGGVVLADGTASSDLYMIRVRDLYKSRLLAERAE
jgi:Tol biopolymer transport system component